MEHLWAPWRMEYILEDKAGGCIFCDKQKERKDEENYILERGKNCFTIMNLYPYNSGHLMVVPYRHLANLEEFEEDELLEMMTTVTKWIKILKKAMSPEGFNTGANIGKIAGAGVDGHIHIHIVPRWTADTNFMPVISETKVMPELLKETFKELKAVLEKEQI